MIRKFYPQDQVVRYLIIDIVTALFFIGVIITEESELHFAVKVLLALVYFVAFYAGLWIKDVRIVFITLVGCTVLTILSIYIDFPFVVFGTVFADFLGRANEKKWIWLGSAIIAIMFFVVLYVKVGYFEPVVVAMMVFQMFYPWIIRYIENTRRLQMELDKANLRLEQYIQEEERNRIARDLHDTLGQTLTLIKIKSELSLRLIEKDPERTKKEIHDILTTTRMAIKQVREVVEDMKHVSFQKEIHDSYELLQSAGIVLKVEGLEAFPSLSSREETTVALALREAITNTARHSGATECSVTIERVDDDCTIRIRDNGIGFTVAQDGQGLLSLKERLMSLHGHVDISSGTGIGTVVTMTFPVREGSVLYEKNFNRGRSINVTRRT